MDLGPEAIFREIRFSSGIPYCDCTPLNGTDPQVIEISGEVPERSLSQEGKISVDSILEPRHLALDGACSGTLYLVRGRAGQECTSGVYDARMGSLA
jgi:hypothetical protein